MKGLLIKDMYLITQNKKSFLIYLFCCVFMFLSVDVSFVAGYIAMLMGIIALSTLSYDEYDKGMTFLMTLPVDGRTYVREKFLLIAIMELIGIATGIAFMTISLAFRGALNTLADNVVPTIALSLTIGSFLTLMIPIELKFGVEKGRIAMMVIYGGIGALVAVAAKLFPSKQDVLLPLVAKLDSIPSSLMALFAILTIGCVIAVTYFLSLKVMEKKEF